MKYNKKEDYILEKSVNEEEVVVFNANAVIDPGAVVVKSLHALMAYTAMARPFSSDGQTVWAYKG